MLLQSQHSIAMSGLWPMKNIRTASVVSPLPPRILANDFEGLNGSRSIDEQNLHENALLLM
jgi:hypothetical protein